MDLYMEILSRALAKEETHIIFPNMKMDAALLVESESYKALQKIKAAIEDDSLDYRKCFMKIEEIVRLFEQIGSSGRARHDFG